MRRRKRSGGTWLPVYGTALEGFDPDTPTDIVGFSGTLNQITGTRVCTHIQPVTTDEAINEQPLTNSIDTLSGIIGNEWFLRRIVGKIFIAAAASADTGTANVLVGAGFFVARAQNLLGNVPVGTPATEFNSDTNQETSLSFNNYSPLANSAQREPWIWHRTWVLGTNYYEGEVVQPRNLGQFPSSNASYGSAYDGPHVDAKTRRRISNDDRLWFAIAATQWPMAGGGTDVTTDVAWSITPRLFGSLRKARNRGAF